MTEATVHLGTFFHAPVRGEVECLEGAAIVVGADGMIARVVAADADDHAAVVTQAERAGRLNRIGAGCYVLPGFVDLHIHAPQYPQLGTALDKPLEVWLQQHTFPLEARYSDMGFAARAYAALVSDLLAQGTTTAMMFASIHVPATKLLVDLCVEKGLRALIGKVAMNDPEACPDFYRDESVDAALKGTEAIIDHVRTHPGNRGGLVLPVVTPRFIPSCTAPLLDELGAMAKACGCHVQSHGSESDWEDSYVLQRSGLRDAAAHDRHGLLGRRTILAHGVLLNDADMDLMIARGAGVAHCPVSNIYFSNAVFPLRAALDKGLRVGLGTDISGGPSASIFDNIRMSVHASRMLEDGVDPKTGPAERGSARSRVDWRTAFHVATAGGADALDLPVGSFAPGRAFDAVTVDVDARAGTIRVFEDFDDRETLLQKILMSASRANVREVRVQGRLVAGTATEG